MFTETNNIINVHLILYYQLKKFFSIKYRHVFNKLHMLMFISLHILMHYT